MKKKYDHKAKSLFTDTDSLTNEIEKNMRLKTFIKTKANLISANI